MNGARLSFAIAGVMDVLMLSCSVCLEGGWGPQCTMRESESEGMRVDVRLRLRSIAAASIGAVSIGPAALLSVAS